MCAANGVYDNRTETFSAADPSCAMAKAPIIPRHPPWGAHLAIPNIALSSVLVLCFRGSKNHIDASINLVLRSAPLRASRRTATSETEPAAILRDGASRLLRMRSVGLSSIHLIRLVSWNRSTRARGREKSQQGAEQQG